MTVDKAKQNEEQIPEMRDDRIAAIQIGEGAVRGRIVRLGPALDEALGGDRYPEPVARLLGEAVLLSALVASSLKFDGRLLVQAHGTNEGAVSLLVAESTSTGHIRAYARYDETALARVLAAHKTPTARALIGPGTFAMTIDSDIHKERYQGIAAIAGDHLSDAAESYYETSEQIPTKIHLAVGRLQQDGAPHWRGGGLMIQRVAGDETRGDVKESWDHARAVMATLKDIELIDPALPPQRLLYQLFHEQGVRMDTPRTVKAECNCSRARLLETIKTFDQQARKDMLEDGKVTAKCQFCDEEHVFSAKEIGL